MRNIRIASQRDGVLHQPTPRVRPQSRLVSWAATVPMILLVPALILVYMRAAASGDPAITVLPSSVASGSKVTAVGEGFAKGETGQIVLDDSSVELAEYKASGHGSFRVSFVLQDVAAGAHRVTAVTIDNDGAVIERAAVMFTVTANDEPLASATPSLDATPVPSTPKPTSSPSPSSNPPPSSLPSASPIPPRSSSPNRVYAYYYLWWSTKHWTDKLGPNFPYDLDRLPLPATLDPEGCSPVSLYDGNRLTDTPAHLYSVDDRGKIEFDVRTAAAAGISGFLVNWNGNGTINQTPTSTSNNKRLDAMIQAAHTVNAEGLPFKLWISYKASAVILPEDVIRNDLGYLKKQYANDSAWDHTYSPRIMLIWQGSRKYTATTIHNVSSAYRNTFFLVGDENWNTWAADSRAADLDGDMYYWSSQNPYTNPNSFTQLQDLASQVRSSGTNPDGSAKLWFAPFTPGYDSVLNGGSTCVKRDNVLDRGATMRSLFQGNAATNPDAWAFISWNEITEGTYVEPLQRWGSTYLDVLASIISAD